MVLFSWINPSIVSKRIECFKDSKRSEKFQNFRIIVHELPYPHPVFNGGKVHFFTMFQDNFGYLITDDKSNRAATVDPGDGDRIGLNNSVWS
jgi:hypothetical protein